MATIYDVDVNDLIAEVSTQLKSVETIKAPEWAPFVKTGIHKERAPSDPEWWYTRSAAVLRAVAKLGPVGVSKLRVKYGGKQDRGVKRYKFQKGSGSVIRKVLQQLETSGFIEQKVVQNHKGRVATAKGMSLLDSCAKKVQGKKE